MSLALHPRGFVGFRGFGDVSGATFLPGVTNAGAVGLSTQGVLQNPGIFSASAFDAQGQAHDVLSPPSSVALTYLKTTIDSVAGRALETATTAIISALPNSVLSMISEVVSTAFDVIPIVGAFVSFVSMGFDIAAQNKAAHKASEQRQCQLYMEAYKLVGSGGGYDPCQTCPADLFYPSIVDSVNISGCNFAAMGVSAWTTRPRNAFLMGDQNYYPGQEPSSEDRLSSHWGPNNEVTYAWRPALGQALMRITEGSFVDAYEARDPATMSRFIRREIDALKAGFGDQLIQQKRFEEWGWWTQSGGIPSAVRSQFVALRRGIQACSKYYVLSDPTGKRVLSDAGLSLWPIYLDLLSYCFAVGWLNEEYVRFMLRYAYFDNAVGFFECSDFTPNPGRKLTNRAWFGDGRLDSEDVSGACADSLASQISALVSSWRNTVWSPATAAGAAAVAAARTQAAAIATQVANPKTKPKLEATLSRPQLVRLGRPAAPVKKAQPGAAVLGAGVAAGLIYLFL